MYFNFVGRATRKKLGDKWSSYRSLENSREVSGGRFRDVGNSLAKKREETGIGLVRGQRDLQ